MSDLRLVGAVGIKVRPDTSKFRGETQKGINEQLGPQGDKVNAKVKVKVDADTKQAEVKIERFEKSVDGKEVTLNVGLDHDSVARAREQIDRALKSLDNQVFKFGLDRPSLEKVKAELEKLAKNAKVEFEFIQDESGYKSVLDKIKKIRNERDLKTMWEFGIDEKSLKEAERKANAALDRIQADKTIDIRYSDNYDGMKKAIAELDAQLEDIRKLRITTKLDEESLKAARADLVDMMQFADVTVRFNEDKQGYETVLSRIRAIQREKLEKEITFRTDDESLRQEALKYEQLIEDYNQRAELAARFAPVTIEYNEDLKGYQDALAHIKKIQREKLVKKITFNTDEAALAHEVEKFQKLVDDLTPPKTIDIHYDTHRDSLQAAIKQIDDELKKLDAVKLPVNLDPASLLMEKRKLQLMLAAAPLKMNFHPDEAGYQSILKKINDIRRQRIEQSISFTVDEDGPTGLAATEQEIRAKLKAHIQEVAVKFRAAMDAGDIEEAKHQAEQLKDHIDHMKASMQIEAANTEVTAARLAFLGRDRVVNYIAKVNERSIAVTEGLLKSLGGMNTFEGVGKSLEGIFTKFDTYSLKATALASALGSVADVGVYVGTAAFKIGEGVVQSLGLLAAAPAILGAATAGYTIFTAAFNNFFDAFNKDPKIAASSLAALPPLARKTVDSITGLYKGLANPIQERFWSHVGTTLSDAIEKLYPNLKTKLLDSTDAVGDFVAGFGRSMTKLAINGDLDKMFDGFKGFFVNLSKASEPFFDGWNKFGVQGSALLPMFGDWIAKMAGKFDAWATKLSANGGINDMIMHGVHSLQEMWAVGGDIVDIFKAITRAAGLAGTGGLAQFQVNLRKIADTMLSEPWQSKAANIFKGARDGASKLNEGFGDLTRTFGNASEWLGTVLTQLGDIGGQTLTNLSDLFGSQKYQNGVSAELQGVQTLVDSLRPSFFDLGNIIGDMGRVAGSVFSNMGPVINQLMSLIAGAVSTLSNNLVMVAPKILNTVGGVIGAIKPLADSLVNVFNGLLGIMAVIPNSFVTLGVAATAFFALRGLAGKFFDSFKQTGTFKNLESNFLTSQLAAGKFTEKMKMVNGEMVAYKVPTEKFSATSAAYGAVTSGAGKLRDQFHELNGVMQRMDGTTALSDKLKNLGTVAMPGVKAAASGLLSFLGGGWGIAFMAASAVIGIFAQNQADASRHVDELTASLDKQSGQANAAGLQAIAKSWTDIGKANDPWANLFRGSKAANETASMLKLNLADVTKVIAAGGKPSDELGQKLNNLAGAMTDVEQFDPGSGSRALEILKNKANDAAGAFGFSADELEKMGLHASDVQHLADNFNKEAAAVALSKKVFEGLAQATGTSTESAKQMATAMQQIGDSSTTAASKIGAINKALDLLHGGKLSAREAKVQADANFQSAVEQAAQLKETLAGGAHLIDQTTGLIDTTSAGGLKLQQTMSTAADGIKIAAQAAATAAKDAGGNAQAQADAAQKVVDDHKNDLKAIADAAGVDVATIQQEWDGFFGKKWELSAVFTASADKFQAAQKVVEEAGLEWNDKSFEAVLAANPDPAKMTTESAQTAARNFANGVYQAQLAAMNQDALAVILKATGTADAYARGDYIGVMRALNSTDPGVVAARNNLLNATTHDGAGWQALIKAYADAVAAANARAVLDDLAKTRTAYINAVLNRATLPDLNGDASGSGRPGTFNGGYFPGGVRTMADMFKGAFPAGMVNFYANGGIEQRRASERHIAQIARPSASYRVWAEPETGGEAYIPLAASKRNRSTQILEQVAQQFGYSLTKGRAFKDGGVVTGGNNKATSGLQVHIGTYNQHANDTVDDIGRGIMRQARNAGVSGILDGI